MRAAGKIFHTFQHMSSAKTTGFWSLFLRHISHHRGQINTRCASPISPSFFHSLLRDLGSVQCCGENWMNNLPWETNNIMDPECLLSVMRPNRRLDRRKWCVVLCWDNSPGPPQMTAAEIWSVHKPQVLRILKGPPEKTEHVEQGKWVTPRSEQGMGECEGGLLLQRDPQVSVCVCVRSVTLNTYK